MPNSKQSSETISEGIRVIVNPDFYELDTNSIPFKYKFSYRIDITNLSDYWVKLISRHWIIINSDGSKDEVKGAGVVGYFPELKPGNSFTYTSFCILETNWGTMEGSFEFIKEDGSNFFVNINRFYLIYPELLTENGNEIF